MQVTCQLGFQVNCKLLMIVLNVYLKSASHKANCHMQLTGVMYENFCSVIKKYVLDIEK